MPTLSERLGVNSTTVHPSSRVAKALARAGVAKTPELMRVVTMPRRVFDENAYPSIACLYAKTACGRVGCQYCEHGDPTTRAIQNAMVIEAAQQDGGFFNVGIGKGKTLASFLMHDALGATRTVLLVPAQLKSKTLKNDLPELDLHYVLPPVHDPQRFAGKSGVYVVAYEELSDTGASDLLDVIKPDLIVADEAHRLRNPKAARTRRFLRYARKHPVKFVAMTGSAMSKLLTDFAHLIELALGKFSPVPRDYPSLKQWSDCIDAGTVEIGALALMCEDHESAREGFQRRFRETPGVICTVDPSCETPLEIRLFKLTPPPAIVSALAELDKSWAWDGEEYDQVLEVLRIERQIAQGFYYRAIWPGGIPDREWLEKRNAWRRAIRKRLAHTNKVGQDSPALLEAMARAGTWTPPEWVDWLGVCDRPEPGREAVEIDKWLLPVIQVWIAHAPEPGIIWVDSPVVGYWIGETGIPFFGEGQDDAVNAMAREAMRARIAGQVSLIPTIALSMRAHGTGKNLQAWARNLVLYPPASSDTWEQMIGRTHRPGQRAERVEFDVVLASRSAETAMENAFTYAKSIEEIMGQPQRLLLAEKRDPDLRLHAGVSE